MTRLLAAILAAVVLLAVGAQPAFAEDVKTKIDVTARANVKVELGYVIDARVQTADGKAIGDATVRFYELVDFFGPRAMLLGSATTDSQGVASLAYLPALTGTRQIVARFARREDLAAAEGRYALEAAVAKPAFSAARQPLAAFSDRVPYVVGVVVLAVWGLIGFALLATARGVIGGARGTSRKEGPA